MTRVTGNFGAPVRASWGAAAVKAGMGENHHQSARFPYHIQHVGLRFGAQTTSVGFNQLKIMTYNMENFFVTPQAGRAVKSPAEIRALGDAIRRENPDIIAAQEVENAAALELLNQSELGGAYQVVMAPKTNDTRGIGVGYLIRSGITVVDWKTHVDVTDTSGNKVFRRDALLAHVRVPLTSGESEDLLLLNTHLKSMRGGEGKTTPARIAEAEAIHQIVTDLQVKNPDARILLMGDMNTKHTSRWGQPVMDAFQYGPAGSPASLAALEEVFIAAGKAPATHNYQGRGSKLDYIFVSPNLLADKQKAAVSGQFNRYPWANASDHLPSYLLLKTRASQAAQIAFKGYTPTAATRVLAMA